MLKPVQELMVGIFGPTIRDDKWIQKWHRLQAWAIEDVDLTPLIDAIEKSTGTARAARFARYRLEKTRSQSLSPISGDEDDDRVRSEGGDNVHG